MSLLLSVAVLCVVGTARAQQPVTRDSAGVQIVENRSRTAAPTLLRLGDTPSINVGGLEADPAVEFDHRDGYIRGALLSNGGLAVIDVWRVHFFDGRGTRTRISGARGQGPLEFAGLTGVCVTRGDTLVVVDSRNALIGILDPNGSIVRTIPRDTLGGLGFNGCLGDGTFLLTRTVGASVARGQAGQVRIVRVRVDGSVANAVATYPGAPVGTPSVRVDQAAGGNRIYLLREMENQIRVMDPNGMLIRIIRTTDPLRPLSAQQTSERTGRARAIAAQMGRAAIPVPTHWPPYGELHVGSDGWLWAQEYHASSSEPQVWVAFDTSGVLVRRLVIPRPSVAINPSEVIGFGRGTIMVRRYDENGATFISVYPLLRASGG
jgi:hypothetical protein